MPITRANAQITNIFALIVLLLAPVTVLAQTYTTSPPPFLLAQNNSGVIINNSCIWTYTAGTTTAATTYIDAAGTPNANPIRSDSAGRFTAFLSPGNSYKFVYETACTPPAHGTTLKTADNISAMPPSGVNVDITGTAGETITAGSVAYLSDGSGSKAAGQWYNASSSNTYSSSAALFAGLAVSTVTSGNPGSFRVSGRMTGLSSLTVGFKYYIASSAGTITSTIPANQRFIGAADSTTSLLVAANPQTTNTTAPINIAEGRLTATTATPVTTADVSAATSIFYTPYIGSRIALYDGSAFWNIRTFTEITISITTCTASLPYDVFLYDNATVVTAEILAWTNATTRATALVRQDGVLVKTGALTRRYVGSFYCNATGGQTDDSRAKRYVWNYYNRVRRELYRTDSTDSWTYTTATIRQANGSTANQVDVMVGVADVTVDLRLMAQVLNGTANVQVQIGIGEDSTTTYITTDHLYTSVFIQVASVRQAMTAHVTRAPAVGRHFYTWLEFSAATGTTTWYGDDGGQALCGLVGSIEG